MMSQEIRKKNVSQKFDLNIQTLKNNKDKISYTFLSKTPVDVFFTDPCQKITTQAVTFFHVMNVNGRQSETNKE